MNQKQEQEQEADDFTHEADQNQQIIHLLSILYRHHIFQEFRSPVLVQYPALCESYLTKITHPIDLGTLLVKALRHELTITELREDLQLLITNALLFNKDYSPYIIAVTKHLEMMAIGLFEEMFLVLYHHPSSLTSLTLSQQLTNLKDKTKQMILSKRTKRYELIQSVTLNEYELSILETVIRNFPMDALPSKLPKLFSQTKLMVMEAKEKLEERTARLLASGNENTEVISDVELEGYENANFTLKQLFDPVITMLMNNYKLVQGNNNNTTTKNGHTNNSSSSSNNNNNDLSGDRIPLLISYYFDKIIHLPTNSFHFFEILDEMLGLLLVNVEERVYRGVAFSNCWNIPYPTCIWSQITTDTRHRNQWWPGMILVSHSPSYPMSLEVMEKNLDRLPKSYFKDLIKFRPKLTATTSVVKNDGTASDDGNSDVVDLIGNEGKSSGTLGSFSNKPTAPSVITSISCPEGYLLVEYFGAHDLGWVKADLTVPMDENGELPKFPKLCAKDVFEEAEEARKALKKFHQSAGRCITTATAIATGIDGEVVQPQDLPTIPSLEELQKSIEPTPELIKAKEDFEKQQILKQQKKEAELLKKEAAAASAMAKANNNNHNSETTSSRRRESSSSSSKKKAPSPSADDENGHQLVKEEKTRKPSSRNSSSNALSTPTRASAVVEIDDKDGDEDNNDDDQENDEGSDGVIPIRNARARASKPKSTALEIVDNRGNVLTHVPTTSKLRPLDFKNSIFEKAIVNSKFYVSKCPNPAFIVTNTILPGFHTKKGINYRRNAMVKSRGFTYWLNKLRPIPFTEPITVLPPSNSSSKANNNNNNPHLLQKDEKGHLSSTPSSGGKKKNTSIRAYQVPLVSNKRELANIPTSEFFNQFHETLLEVGCSRYYNGKGLIYSRIVDFNHPIFFREDPDPIKRKEKIIAELKTLKYLTEKLVKGEGEEEDEDEFEEEYGVERPSFEENEEQGNNDEDAGKEEEEEQELDQSVDARSAEGGAEQEDELEGEEEREEVLTEGDNNQMNIEEESDDDDLFGSLNQTEDESGEDISQFEENVSETPVSSNPTPTPSISKKRGSSSILNLEASTTKKKKN